MPIAVLAAAVLAAPQVPEVIAGDIIAYQAPASQRFGERLDIWIWLPPGYSAQPDKRFPVLYMHDGQNLFDPKLTNYGKSWDMDEAIPRLAAQGDLREWIVVGIRSPKARYETLFPEKLYDLMPPERQARFTSENDEPLARDEFKGDEYLDWLVHELKPAIDGAYRTLPGKDDTAIIGASMGALASLYAIGEYPDVFGSAAALSNPLMLGVYDDLDTETDVPMISEAWGRWVDGTKLRAGGANLIYSDTGTVGMDGDFAPYLDGFDDMMAERGWSGTDYQSRRYLGAEHDELFWHQRVDVPLAFIDRSDP